MEQGPGWQTFRVRMASARSGLGPGAWAGVVAAIVFVAIIGLVLLPIVLLASLAGLLALGAVRATRALRGGRSHRPLDEGRRNVRVITRADREP